MLKKVENCYAVVSDEGFAVSRSGSPLTRFVMHYHEGSRTLDYPLENLMPGSVTPIVVSLIKNWNSPHNVEPLLPDKRLQIAERLRSAMEFLGDKCCVVR
jgi:hypothetical protein